MNKFTFNIFNIETIYSNLCELKNNSHVLTKEINLISSEKNAFLFPIEGIHINFAVNHLDNSKISILSIIKTAQNNLSEIKIPNDKKSFEIRKIENFGVYIFAGRPDLNIDKEFSDYLDLNNKNEFLTKLGELISIIENLINNIYKENNINSTQNNEYCFKIEPSEQKKYTQVSDKQEKEIPDALKRLYKKIGK